MHHVSGNDGWGLHAHHIGSLYKRLSFFDSAVNDCDGDGADLSVGFHGADSADLCLFVCLFVWSLLCLCVLLFSFVCFLVSLFYDDR